MTQEKEEEKLKIGPEDMDDVRLEGLEGPLESKEVVGRCWWVMQCLVRLLKKHRVAGLHANEDGTIRWMVAPVEDPRIVNQVDESVFHGKKIQWTHPIISDGRPRYVGMREDGQLWECELIDADDPEEAPGG